MKENESNFQQRVTEKLCELKKTIMKSQRNMIITGASVVAFLLMLVVAFSGSRDVLWHVDRLVLSFNQMGDAARWKDANGFLDAFENYVLVQESAYINRTTLDRKINTMQDYELIAIENQIEFAAE